MKLSFLKKIPVREFYILLDIRSSSIAGAIVSVIKNSEPTIEYTVRKKIFFDDSENVENFINKSYKNLEDVLDEIVGVGFKKIKLNKNESMKIEDVFCTLASPWYKSKIKNFSVNEKEPVTFTEEYLNKILVAEKNIKDLEKDNAYVDKKILSVFMNGYQTEDPYGKSANNISLSFYNSFINKKTKKEIREIIFRKLHSKKITFYTHPVLMVSVIKNIFHSMKNFLMIDVSGEITEIGLFRDGIFQSFITVPIGTNFFVRELVSKCSIDKETAVSQLNLLCGNKLDEKCSEKTNEILKSSTKEWSENISSAIKKEWEQEIIPPILFLTVDNECKELMQSVLTDKQTYGNILKMNREPILHILNQESVNKFSNYREGAKKDSLLTIFSMFVSLENQ